MKTCKPHMLVIWLSLLLIACGDDNGSTTNPGGIPPSPVVSTYPPSNAADVERNAVISAEFREDMDPDRGMLFVFEEEGVYPFWMKNTLIPPPVRSPELMAASSTLASISRQESPRAHSIQRCSVEGWRTRRMERTAV